MDMHEVVQRMEERSDGRAVFRAPLQRRRPLRSRRARRLKGVAGVGAVLVVFIAGALYFEGSRTTVVPLDTVVERFRAEAAKGVGSAAATPGPARAGTAGTPERTEVVAQQDDATAPTAQATQAALPPQGVYRYRATGGEKLSVFGAEHRYPEQVYTTIRHTGGCGWEGRIDVLEEHVDRIGLCTTSGRIEQTSQSRSVEFFGVRQSRTIDCDPPLVLREDGAAGTHTAHCRDGQGSFAEITSRSKGIEAMRIGDRSVDALHLHLDTVLTGEAEGTSTDDVWLSPTTGMLYRWKRLVDIETGAAFGVDARYTEDAEFVLTSLDPQT